MHMFSVNLSPYKNVNHCIFCIAATCTFSREVKIIVQSIGKREREREGGGHDTNGTRVKAGENREEAQPLNLYGSLTAHCRR